MPRVEFSTARSWLPDGVPHVEFSMLCSLFLVRHAERKSLHRYPFLVPHVERVEQVESAAQPRVFNSQKAVDCTARERLCWLLLYMWRWLLAAARCDACYWMARCWLLLTVECKAVAPLLVLSNTIAVLAEYMCTGINAVV